MVIPVGSLSLTFSSSLPFNCSNTSVRSIHGDIALEGNMVEIFFLLRVLKINCYHVKCDNNSCYFVFHMLCTSSYLYI